MIAWSPRERVMAAIHREEPDRVPYCELGIDRVLAARLMEWEMPASQAMSLEANPYSADQAKAIARRIGSDNICFVLRAPVYAHKLAGKDGRLFYGDGMIRSEADLDLLELPDPTDDALYADAEQFAANKGEYAAWFVTRIGIFPTFLSMGAEAFSIALYENRALVETILDRYCDWIEVVAQRVCQLGFDVFFSTDDMAFKSAPFFSPKIFRELVLPRFQKVRESITIPWCMHSDGNLMPFVDDLVGLGIAGLHPIEKGAMDMAHMKTTYGDRICLLGNVDLNLLGAGTPEAVDAEVKELIRVAGEGGGYIVTSGNSLAAYCLPENVLAMSHAVKKYGLYRLT